MAAELLRKCKFLNELNSEHVLNSKVDENEMKKNDISISHQQKEIQEKQQQQLNGNKRLRNETPPTTDSEDADEANAAKDDNGKEEEASERIKPKKSKLSASVSSSSSSTSSLSFSSIKQNQQNLLAAIQLKILQLQNDLNELNDSEEDDIEDGERFNINLKISAQDAEAIGFATCAQETLLFLQNEGISNESELYKKLRETLTGEKQE